MAEARDVSALSDADQQQIVAVIRRADELATARDVDGYLALTTPDMVLDGTQGDASGRDAVRSAIGGIWAAEPVGTRHVTSDVVVTSSDDTNANAHSTLTLIGADGEVRAVASISQSLRKTDGTWLIARRSVG
ncbi:YybH family protein [Agreia pratensis]|uniref:SnoaL-like domain-containing protein n=1 Tax=Agreia pratensis TaxID=150121 RepID=A0A1X7KUH3_9MICO|nr:nuclear transport factor 2 family protein [Agreia pratensis]SMG44887.1 conserved hypothetical protein [Agreia pratensis]